MLLTPGLVPLTVVTEPLTGTSPRSVAPSSGAVMHSRMLYSPVDGPQVTHGVPAASAEAGARGYGRTWGSGVSRTRTPSSQLSAMVLRGRRRDRIRVTRVE